MRRVYGMLECARTLFRLFRSSLCETKGRTRKRGTVQLARAPDPPRANVSKRMATRQAVHARNCTRRNSSYYLKLLS